MSAEGEARGLPWTDREIDLVVAAYLGMLDRQRRGEASSKAEHVTGLLVQLPARSRGSIERKLQNISAVLEENHFEWLKGYVPLSHYQDALRAAVLAALVQEDLPDRIDPGGGGRRPDPANAPIGP